MKRRHTQHKKAVLRAFENNHLLSAKELEQQIADADQSTIYRNLKRLSKDGVLKQVQIGLTTKYELAEKHADHSHFICKSCEDVKAIYLDEAAIKAELPTGNEFSVTVRGVCNGCKNKQV